MRPILAIQSDRMDTRIIKIALSAAAFGYTVYLFATGSWGYGIWMLLLTAIMVVFTFRSVRLLWALIQLRRQKLEKAVKIVDGINPEKLWKKSQGYYHFINGTLMMQEGKVMPAEKQFRRALNLGLRADHDKATAKLSLSMVAMAKNRQSEAKNLIKEAKKLDKRGVLSKDIREIEQMMKKPPKVMRQKHQRHPRR